MSQRAPSTEAGRFRPGLCILFACVVFLASAIQAQTYTIVANTTILPAGSNGATLQGTLQGTIQGTLPGGSSPSADISLCFYTGYGSVSPIVPASFAHIASGARFTISVPASTIQQVPPSAFSGGSFAALLYTVPPSTSSCLGPAQALLGASTSITLEYPVLRSLSLSSVPQQNPNLAVRLPARLELVGTNFIAQSSVFFTVPGPVAASIAANAALIDPSSILSSIPGGLPGTAASVDASVCNIAVYSYCSGALTLQLSPLQVESGTVTASPALATSLQPVTVNATFGSGTASIYGAPSGPVTFTDNGGVVSSSALTLDETAVFVAAPTASFTTDSRPVQPIVVDLNEDGVPDLLFIEPNATVDGAMSPVIHVLLGVTPAGQFAADKHYNGLKQLPCITLLSTAVADFTGDGYPDIAILCSNPNAAGPPNKVIYTLFNGNSDGLEGQILSYGPVFGDRIEAADFNRDGKPDLVVIGAVDGGGDTGLQVLLGNGDGSFHAGPVTSGLDTAPSASFGGFHTAVADLNNDGYPDIAVLNGSSASGAVDNFIQVLQNDGTGVFTQATTVPTDGTNTARFFLAPLGPGQMPAIILSSLAAGSSGISVARNKGTSGIAFSVASQSTPVPGLTQAIVGDFNGDGLLDLAVSDANFTRVLTGDGTGLFAATYHSLSIVPPAGATMLAASDENGDGYADLLESVTTAGVTTIYDYITSGSASASLTGVNFVAGAHHIVATTAGTVEMAGASAATDLAVNPATPVIALTASATSPIVYGSLLTLYGTIPDPAVTGSVSFYNGTALVGTVPLISNGTSAVASFAPSTLPAGSYSFTAVYGGDAAHTSALSAALAFVISPLASTLAWDPVPASIPYGAPLSATVLNATATGLDGTTIPGTFTYSPALGTVLKVGAQLLSVTFTPTSSNYLPATASAKISVTRAAVTLAWTPNPSNIVYGTSLSTAQLDASAAALYAASVPGTFVYTPGLNASLATGSHTLTVAFTPNDALDFSAASASTSITVSRAVPVITWPTPADVIVDTALSSTQLDATATTSSGATIPGTFVYTPASSTLLPVAGTDTLSVTFTPTDTANYTTASASVSINVGPLGLSSVVPSAALLGDAAKTVAITGTGFSTASVVRVAAVPLATATIPTTYISSTSMTAVIPASYFQTVQTLQLFVYDPGKDLPSNMLPITVSAPSTSLEVTAPTTISPASQTTILFHLDPYPAPVDATFLLAFKPSGTLPDDPGILFVESGLRTATIVVPAHANVLDLPVTFQGGTIVGTLTLTLSLEAGGASITPASIHPIVMEEPAAPAGISSVAMQQEGDLLTVTTRGYSNTRKVTGAEFHFAPVSGAALSTPAITIDATALFSTWYADPESDQYGSLFTYTEVFNLSSDASVVGQVTVTLTNDVGTSQEANTP